LCVRFIETHSKTLTNALALFCSIGGWFLWNIILSCLYTYPSKIYYVRNTFLHLFGPDVHWWATLILILLAVTTFEFATISLRSAFLTTDEDVFQALEKDPEVKRRFEEAASGELQQGWDRKKDQEAAVREVVEKVSEREQERREREVGEMLRKRGHGEEAGMGLGDGGDVNKVLSRGFGDVR
jgi:phospholipid-translocating ATPase